MFRRISSAILMTAFISMVIACGSSSVVTKPTDAPIGEGRDYWAKDLFLTSELCEVEPYQSMGKATPAKLFADQQTRLDFTSLARVEGENYAIKKMSDAGRLVVLPVGTKVEITDRHGMTCTVKVFDGEHAGTRGVLENLHMGYDRRVQAAKASEARKAKLTKATK